MATTAIVYLQILVGATMRHTGAGLAIPDFPLAFGRVVPPVWSAAVAIHFTHRAGAIVVAAAVSMLAIHVWRHQRTRPELARPAVSLVALVAAQITLGAWTVLSGKAAAVNSAHVAVGALVLASSLVIALRAHRARFGGADDNAADLQVRPTYREAGLKARPTTARTPAPVSLQP